MSNIQSTEILGDHKIFIETVKYCILKVTTANNCQERVNKGLSQPQCDRYSFIYFGLEMKRHPLRTEVYYGSKVGDPLLHPVPFPEGDCRTKTQGSSETETHIFVLFSVFCDRIS